MTTFILIFAFVSFLEVTHLLVCGWYINDTRCHHNLNTLRNHLRLNMFNDSIIKIPNGTYASTIFISLICKWHINGLGMVPRWSKTHRLLNQVHKSLLAHKKITTNKYTTAFGEGSL